MSQTRISPAQVRTKAEELRNINAAFKSKTEALEASEGTLAMKWEGDSKRAFHESFLKDKANMDEFYNAIEQYCVTLENIAIRLDNADKTGAGL